MTIRVLFLGRLQDIAGGAECELEPPPGGLDWHILLATLEEQLGPAIAAEVSAEATKVAVNGVLRTDRDTIVARDGDEVAFLPPVSGG